MYYPKDSLYINRYDLFAFYTLTSNDNLPVTLESVRSPDLNPIGMVWMKDWIQKNYLENSNYEALPLQLGN